MRSHGRDPRLRIAVCAILASLWIAPLLPQAPFRFQDLLPELAARIGALAPPGSKISLNTTAADNGSAARQLQDGVATLLEMRGVRVVDAGDGVMPVGLSCSENLRERSCLAEVQTNTTRHVLIVTRPHDGTSPVDSRPAVSLELRPLFAQRTAILDVIALGPRLLVLDTTSVTLYQQAGQDWQPSRSRALPHVRPWPRDVRGRLLVQGSAFGVFLPGMTCSGTLNELVLECAESRQPWPLGIENSGLEPARNYFATPEGLAFYGAAPLGADADARWLVADRNGTLSLLDGSRRPLARVAAAEDVAGITAPCGPESYVVAVESTGGREAVRLFQVTRQRLVPIAAPVFVTGRLTALWAAPGATTATAVAHDIGGGRYEAFLATISCGR